MVFGLGSSGGTKFENLNPMFDRRAEPNAQNVIVARKLLAINDRALPAKSRRARNQHYFFRFPESL